MKKISLATILTLIMTIKTSAIENSFDADTSPMFKVQSVSSSKFRKYVSINLLSLTVLHPQFNLGFRKEAGHNGYDMGMFGEAGRSSTACGGYGSYLYYFNPESNFKFYSGLGLNAGLAWAKRSHGFVARGLITTGLSHIAPSGRNDFYQISFAWPKAQYERLYKSQQNRWYYGRRHISEVKWNVIGISASYGLFF